MSKRCFVLRCKTAYKLCWSIHKSHSSIHCFLPLKTTKDGVLDAQIHAKMICLLYKITKGVFTALAHVYRPEPMWPSWERHLSETARSWSGRHFSYSSPVVRTQSVFWMWAKKLLNHFITSKLSYQCIILEQAKLSEMFTISSVLRWCHLVSDNARAALPF